MIRRSPFHPSPVRQRGLSVITAIFLLLLMSMLAAAMVSIVSTSHLNMAADIGGSRAYQAARGGVEWAMFQLDPNAQSASLPTCASASGTLSGFTGHSVVVTCTSYPSDTTYYEESTRQIRIFQITATATAVGAKAPGIERKIVVTLEKCRDFLVAGAPYDC